jgi:hypothetical protein
MHVPRIFDTLVVVCCGKLVHFCGRLFVAPRIGRYIIPLLAVWGASSLWSIGELFEQRERVAKGWFPKNPKRK